MHIFSILNLYLLTVTVSLCQLLYCYIYVFSPLFLVDLYKCKTQKCKAWAKLEQEISPGRVCWRELLNTLYNHNLSGFWCILTVVLWGIQHSAALMFPALSDLWPSGSAATQHLLTQRYIDKCVPMCGTDWPVLMMWLGSPWLPEQDSFRAL